MAHIDKLLARARANGYEIDAHRKADSLRDIGKHNPKTQTDQDSALKRYCIWRLLRMPENSDMAEVERQYLCRGAGAPNLEETKDFFRFYAKSSQGKIDKGGRPTAESLVTCAEWFFAGFTRTTGTATETEDRSEVYSWIRRTLVAEGVVVNKKMPKRNFGLEDLSRLLIAVWTTDDLVFTPERYRLQFTFILRAYCWTGARIGAFFNGGLRYGDIDLVLQRVPGDTTRSWRLIYQIKQRWVKANRDPENIYFGAAGKDHPKLIYNDAACLLALALADGVLIGVKSVEDVQELEIPPGDKELPLLYTEGAEREFLLKRCTMSDGATEARMPQKAFSNILKGALENNGYFGGMTVHSIRRKLGKQIDERYTAVERGQHLTQADLEVFGRSYVANCSSVDGQAAFLNEQADHSHVEYFQGLEQYREVGLPCRLPAAKEEAIENDPSLHRLKAIIKALKLGHAGELAIHEAKNRHLQHRTVLRQKALHQHQMDFVRNQQIRKILTRGKESAEASCKTDLLQHLFLMIPERARLAIMMASKEDLSPAGNWQAIRDMLFLCTQNLAVMYLPGHEPDKGACPAAWCQIRMESLPKSRRNPHIHGCVRTMIASRLNLLQSQVHYCYQCCDWVAGEGWEGHCQQHLSTITSKRCGSITYCQTVVRPGYCAFCLGNSALPASQRWQSWSRDHKLWLHLEDHISKVSSPYACPHPLCDRLPEDAADLRYHFMDDHGLARKKPAAAARQEPEGITCPAVSADMNSSAPTTSGERGFSARGAELEDGHDQNLHGNSSSLDTTIWLGELTAGVDLPVSTRTSPCYSTPTSDYATPDLATDAMDLDSGRASPLWESPTTPSETWSDNTFTDFLRFSPSPSPTPVKPSKGHIAATVADISPPDCHKQPRSTPPKIKITLRVGPPKRDAPATRKGKRRRRTKCR